MFQTDEGKHTGTHFYLETAMQMVQKLWRFCLQVVPAHLEIGHGVKIYLHTSAFDSIITISLRFLLILKSDMHTHIKLW